MLTYQGDGTRENNNKQTEGCNKQNNPKPTEISKYFAYLKH